MFKKLNSVLLLIMALSLFVVRISYADEEAPPKSYKIVTNNGKYIFVMHAPANIFGGFQGGQELALKTGYPKSGLYRNDSRHELLWAVDWYAFKVYVSSDGQTLIRMGGWPRGSPVVADNTNFDDTLIKAYRKEPIGPVADKKALEQLAIAFYDHGLLVKEYSIGDLVRRPDKLPASVSHFEWVKESIYNDEKTEISVTTYDDQKIVFDKKGNII